MARYTTAPDTIISTATADTIGLNVNPKIVIQNPIRIKNTGTAGDSKAHGADLMPARPLAEHKQRRHRDHREEVQRKGDEERQIDKRRDGQQYGADALADDGRTGVCQRG